MKTSTKKDKQDSADEASKPKKEKKELYNKGKWEPSFPREFHISQQKKNDEQTH